jgi:phage gp36-like protein
MIYINKDFLTNYMHERLINESCQKDTSILDDLELTQISIIQNYIGTRYNIALIFAPTNPLENAVIKEIVAKLLLYALVRRNAARKVPEDYKEQYTEAMKTLKDIATGVIVLSNLPPAVTATGAIVSNSISGNLSNKNFYI